MLHISISEARFRGVDWLTQVVTSINLPTLCFTCCGLSQPAILTRAIVIGEDSKSMGAFAMKSGFDSCYSQKTEIARGRFSVTLSWKDSRLVEPTACRALSGVPPDCVEPRHHQWLGLLCPCHKGVHCSTVYHRWYVFTVSASVPKRAEDETVTTIIRTHVTERPWMNITANVTAALQSSFKTLASLWYQEPKRNRNRDIKVKINN